MSSRTIVPGLLLLASLASALAYFAGPVRLEGRMRPAENRAGEEHGSPTTREVSDPSSLVEGQPPPRSPVVAAAPPREPSSQRGPGEISSLFWRFLLDQSRYGFLLPELGGLRIEEASMERLCDFVREHRFTSTELRAVVVEATGADSVDLTMLLAMAWAEGDPSWLEGEIGAEPSEEPALYRRRLAAAHAGALRGDQALLARAAVRLLGSVEHYADFDELTGGKREAAGVVLAALNEVSDPTVSELLERMLAPGNEAMGLTSAAWAVAARSGDPVWQRRVLDVALAGGGADGLAAMRGEAFLSELQALVENPEASVYGRRYLAASAARGLVSIGTRAAIELVERNLTSDGPARHLVLEALRETANEGATGWLLLLRQRLSPADDKARAAIDLCIERSTRSLTWRPPDPSRRPALLASLSEAVRILPEGSEESRLALELLGG